MKYLYKIVIATFLLMMIVSCSSPENTESLVSNINVTSASDLVKNDENTIILDVRTPEEYMAGHIEGALNINIADENFSEQAAKLDQSKTYIVHCAANVENGRTAKSLTIMQELGFNNLMNLEGGIVAWEKSGQPMIKVSETKDHQE